jgi:hypothetical protein
MENEPRHSRQESVEADPFSTLPEGIYPGMPYSTPGKLLKSGFLLYSDGQLSRIINDKRNPLPGVYRIGRQIILDADAVAALKERQLRSIAGEHAKRGRKVGGDVIRKLPS